MATGEGLGGAAKAAFRIHKSFVELGYDAHLLVSHKKSDYPNVVSVVQNHIDRQKEKYQQTIDFLPVFLHKERTTDAWSAAWFSPYNVSQHPLVQSADVILLYWVVGGFLSVQEIGKILALGKPVFWRLSDMWAFTGGCHYSGSCENYVSGCFDCPQLGIEKYLDLARRQFRHKQNWDCSHLTILAPSQWVADCAKKSKLFSGFNIKVIGTGVDKSVFKHRNKDSCRQIWNLPTDRKVILFGAVNPFGDSRKGGKELIESLKEYAKKIQKSDRPLLIIFGSYQIPSELGAIFDVKALGHLSDEQSLATLYSASDLFIAPSLEDNLPNTVIESLACRTVVVGFRTGGLPELIEDGKNGKLAELGNTTEMGQLIKDCLEMKFSVEEERICDLSTISKNIYSLFKSAKE